MKKLCSLIKASMTSDMSLFKIKTKGSKLSNLLPLFIAFYLMFMIWGSANTMYEKLAPLHIQYVLLPIFVLSVSFMTFMEGIYKTSSLLFNCKDDNLLLSLPISKRTVLLIRVLKFYIFEFLFNSMFLLPAMVAYIRWAESLSWTYFLSSIVMLIILPIIPIALSCIIGAITSSLSSHFKFKNLFQIVFSMIIIFGILGLSYQSEKVFQYLIEHASSLNDLITKIYYPAGVYANMISNFQIGDLLLCILIHIVIFVCMIYFLSIFYFKINSRMKKVTSNKKVNVGSIKIQSRGKIHSFIRKELNTFFQTPVFIINSGFALVLFLIAVFAICFKFDSVLPILTSTEGGLGFEKEMVMGHLSTMIFILISFTAFMTSITNCVVSLEGKNINILKSLPISTKTVLMSKIYACLVITTPVLILGDLILFIRFQIPILECILLLILSVLIPLVSHFIGILMNLKYPKLDFENASEVVKQSTSSFTSVMLGMIFVILTFIFVSNTIEWIPSIWLLVLAVIFYAIVDILFYLRLIHKGIKEFNQLSI